MKQSAFSEADNYLVEYSLPFKEYNALFTYSIPLHLLHFQRITHCDLLQFRITFENIMFLKLQ